jgi:hypothetical protein
VKKFNLSSIIVEKAENAFKEIYKKEDPDNCLEITPIPAFISALCISWSIFICLVALSDSSVSDYFINMLVPVLIGINKWYLGIGEVLGCTLLFMLLNKIGFYYDSKGLKLDICNFLLHLPLKGRAERIKDFGDFKLFLSQKSAAESIEEFQKKRVLKKKMKQSFDTLAYL